MNKQEFLKLILDPSQVTAADSDKLEDVTANFPYCQAAHILIAKIAHQESSMLAKQKLNKAAAYVLDRGKLKKILNNQYSNSPITEISPEKSIEENLINTISNSIISTDIQQEIVEVQNSIEADLCLNDSVQEPKLPNSIGQDNPINNHEEIIEELQIENSLPDLNSEKNIFEEISEDKILPVEQIIKNLADETLLHDFDETKDVITVEDVNLVNGDNAESISLNPQNNYNTNEYKKDLIEDSDKVDKAFNRPTDGNSIIDKRSIFFIELEQNLENLRKLKEKNELKKFIEAEVIPDLETLEIIEAGTLLLDNTPINSDIVDTVDNAVSEVNAEQNYSLYSSRLDEVLMQDEENTSSLINAQTILIDYLNFLSLKKKVLFRSRQKVNSIIDKFITEEPSIPYATNDDYPEEVEDLSEESNRISNHIASENFAKILVRQGKYKKAVLIYNELILKNPEKKAYFTNHIQALNNKIQ